jgi:hypothetical protein
MPVGRPETSEILGDGARRLSITDVFNGTQSRQAFTHVTRNEDKRPRAKFISAEGALHHAMAIEYEMKHHVIVSCAA